MALEASVTLWSPPMNSQALPVKAKRARKAEVPAFGRFLAKLRQRKFPKLAPEAVAERLTQSGVKTTGSSLRGYEFGWNKAIDPVVLAGIARVYGFPLDDLVAVLAANRSRPEMQDFDVEKVLREARKTHHGETAAAARFAEVGPRLRTIAAELIAYAADAAELAGGPGDRPGEPASTDRERAADADSDH